MSEPPTDQPVSAKIRARLRKSKKRFHANDNISAFLEPGEPEPYPVRAFIQTWRELASWWTHYDTAALAAQLTDEQYEKFLATADGTLRFADELRAARDATETRPHLRAL